MLANLMWTCSWPGQPYRSIPAPLPHREHRLEQVLFLAGFHAAHHPRSHWLILSHPHTNKSFNLNLNIAKGKWKFQEVFARCLLLSRLISKYVCLDPDRFRLLKQPSPRISPSQRLPGIASQRTVTRLVMVGDGWMHLQFWNVHECSGYCIYVYIWMEIREVTVAPSCDVHLCVLAHPSTTCSKAILRSESLRLGCVEWQSVWSDRIYGSASWGTHHHPGLGWDLWKQNLGNRRVKRHVSFQLTWA